MVATKPLTVSELLKIEPRIKDIIPLVRNEGNWHFAYSKAKRMGNRLVGWGSENEATAGESAYDAFIQYICGELDKIYG